MKLFYSPGSCSMAAHIVLEETQRQFEPVLVSLKDGAQHDGWFREVNPRGRVPVLELDSGERITELPAILTLIADWSPRNQLLPPAHDLPCRGRALEWLGWLSTGPQIAVAQVWRPGRFVLQGADTDALEAGGRQSVADAFAEIEASIAGPWAIAAGYSVVDPYLLLFYRWGHRLGLDMAAAYPRWTAQTDRVLERAAVQRVLHREGIEVGRTAAAEA